MCRSSSSVIDQNMNKLTLYGYLLCPYVQRVRFALESLKIDYQYINVDLYAGAQKKESFLQINPFGKVPTVNISSQIIYESLILLEFFQDHFGKVFPKDEVTKAHQRIWANYFDQNVINKIWPIIRFKQANNNEAIENQTKEILENIQYFTKHSGLEEQIRKNNKSFFNGDQLSYVDFVVTPFIRLLELFFQQFIQKSMYNFQENNEILEIFQIYSRNVTSSSPFLAITDKLKKLPPIETNSLFKEMGIDAIDKYNYENIFRFYYQKRLSS